MTLTDTHRAVLHDELARHVQAITSARQEFAGTPRFTRISPTVVQLACQYAAGRVMGWQHACAAQRIRQALWDMGERA